MRLVVCRVPVDAGMNLALAEATIADALDTGTRLLVSFVNPHATHLADNADYLSALREMDLILCDGIGMALATSILTRIKTGRVSFDNTSLAPVILRRCTDASIPIFFVGGLPGVAVRAANVLRDFYPGLRVAGAYAGFGMEPDSARLAIADCPRAVVIAGLGAGRQEAFLAALRATAWRGVGLSCGGFMDQSIRQHDYYPAFVDRLNARFLYRLIDEPARLSRRYLIEYQPFLRRFAAEIAMSISDRTRPNR